MKSYLFLFGRTPEMSWPELTVFFPQAQRLSQYCAKVDIAWEFDPQAFLKRIGGSLKIAEYIRLLPELGAADFVELITSRNGQINFSINSVDSSFTINRQLLTTIKKMLTDQGYAVRFITPKHDLSLSSVVYSTNNVTEFLIHREQSGYGVYKTLVVQDFRFWQQIDYDRPYASAKSGMLPPKIAMMAVNIAAAGQTQDKSLLDPFCGMGTILFGAMLANFKLVYGSDLDQLTAIKAEKNVKWLTELYELITKTKVFTSDATHVSDKLEKCSIDCIVTEPFMGPSKIGERKVDAHKVRNIAKGLSKLYIGCFRNWRILLKDGGCVVIAIPSFVIDDRIINVKSVVDSCEMLGYTKLLGPIEYARPQAIVRRQFYLFTYKNPKH
ncbi:hypothetical protein A2154_02035 [Candidatus Gottesmanbacteria bacterium RBG_16_43_7]|uniref:Ribosomal RNA large subunit methyltransferase K/L-like methyltransferase domain-containing protein n=1 Tax=Candidatus Gottesmanbacteria bacterium RBG_16_43_7 TaxID=1798373 RepID=A0A1F5Z950_9BACT|nr:MAG: hypothetical protein A2154_02035 [Candidatus Gottesmanbacteria bacterium RBG_16_43_7]